MKKSGGVEEDYLQVQERKERNNEGRREESKGSHVAYQFR
jgi:hypothetical protein